MHLTEGAALQQRIRHWAVVPRVGGVEGVVALQPHVPLRHLQTASIKYETQAVRFAVHNPTQQSSAMNHWFSARADRTDAVILQHGHLRKQAACGDEAILAGSLLCRC